MREPHTQGRTDSASLVVSARPDAVYGAIADAAALMKWLPPGNMTGRVLEYDFREGGRYRIELTYGDDAPSPAGKTTARTDVTSGRFLSLDAYKRIVQSVEFASADASFAGEMIMTWTFEPLSTDTLVTIMAENVPPGISQSDHDAGLRSSLENLARYLTTRGDTVPNRDSPRGEERPFADSLCWGCANHRTVGGARSLFLMCTALPVKYPRQPVKTCPAFQPVAPVPPATP